jgi:PBP1b-binding outer membrane lipoprotein LpoB
MKKAFIVSAVALCLAFLSGCAATYYRVVTNEGKAFVTDDRPEFNTKTQSYEFTDDQGSKWIIKREDIKSMERKEKEHD